jgi:aspartate aminotransferase-like enzyme
MYLTIEAFRQRLSAYRALAETPRHRAAEPLNFLPGPVAVHPEVSDALLRPAVSHRSAAFVNDFQSTRQALCRLANANHVDILMGSGTLANDAIAAEMTLWSAPGLILSNGTFGERLIDHATRFRLRFQVLKVDWGQPFDRGEIEKRLDDDPSLRWMWAVHGETSTGMLNDLAMLKDVTAVRGIRLSIDAVSSLGATPLDLRGVSLASGVSGKGLGASPGLALVFRQAAGRPPSPALPRYLDLGLHSECEGIPFTISSNLLYALKVALAGFEWERHFVRVTELASRLWDGLQSLDLAPIAKSDHFPAVTTIALPPVWNSTEVGQRMESAGYLLHYRSDYLVDRNWIQVCLMGRCTVAMIDELVYELGRTLA